MLPSELIYRAQTEADEMLLYCIYASTRANELAAIPWTEEQKAAFLEMQFRAQSTHYAQHFPNAAFFVIERGGEPIGRLYLDRTDREIHIIDIALLPHAQGHGLGTRMIQELLDEARKFDKIVAIHVERNNPALALYTRLGFEAVGEQGVYQEMRWTAERIKVHANTAS